jgi:hypothetical protein
MRTGFAVGCVTLALVLTLVVGTGPADQGTSPASPEDLAKAFGVAGQPGPAHAKLQSLTGNWTNTCTIWMALGQPPVETKGIIECKWILGGRFLEERYAGTGFDGKPGFDGFGLLGYDNKKQKITYAWACNMGTGTSTGVGVSETSGSLTLETT